MDTVITVAIALGVVLLVLWVVQLGIAFFFVAKAMRKQDPDPDIRLSYLASGWQYRFIDPHGVVVIRTGYSSRRKAIKAACAHRAQVGRQLELSLRLDELVGEP